MKTEFGMKRIVITKLDVPKSICFKVSFLVTTCSVLRQLWQWFTTKWSLGLVTCVTHTKNLTFLNCHQARLPRLPGTARWFSFVVWPRAKLTSQTHCLTQLLLTRHLLLPSRQQATPQCFAALQFAPIWAASQCLISAPTRAGFVFATDLCTISLVALDRVQQQVTCLTLTIRCTGPFFVLRNKFSLTNPASSCMYEKEKLFKL